MARADGYPPGHGRVRFRCKTGLTGEQYVTVQGWRNATLMRCPHHPGGGCSLARHGTYPRKTPAGVRIARWYCPESHTTFSLLPDCLAARLPGTLAELEEAVATAERSPSVATRLPLPSHAAAAACLATSGPPAFGTPPLHALPVSQARPGSLPVTHDMSCHDPIIAETPECFPGSAVIPRFSAPRPLVATPPIRALPQLWRTVPLRCVDRLLLRCCSMRHLGTPLRCLHNAGHFVRQRHPRATSDCGAP